MMSGPLNWTTCKSINNRLKQPTFDFKIYNIQNLKKNET